jgi:hypothetical protein
VNPATRDREPEVVVYGGTGNDTLTLSGDGYIADGGAGADLIDLGDAECAIVLAGAGDSVTGGSGDGNHVIPDDDATFTGGAGAVIVWNGSTGPVHTGGGAGNDFIRASHGDLVTLGPGTDILRIHQDETQDAAATTVTDFDPAAEQALIYCGSYHDAELTPLAEAISVRETDGNTVISGAAGQTIAVFRGATGLAIGLAPEGDEGPVIDLAGNTVARGEVDVLIQRYLDAFTWRQNSTPGWALMPDRKGCLTSVISVTRSAAATSASLAPRPVRTTCVRAGFSAARNASTSASSR